MIDVLKARVLAKEPITKDEALSLYHWPDIDALSRAANEIREYFCGEGFDLCSIVNAKSGRCPENCRFCAQSIFSHCDIAIYPLLSQEKILEVAKRDAADGVLRFSIVTSGKRMTNREVCEVARIVRAIKAQTNLSVCVSLGLLTAEQFALLKEAGVERIHNNLETSRRFFQSVCTTHTFEDKVRAIRAAQEAGLAVCSGGIVGLGESVADRIDMAFELKALGVKSVPINMHCAIPGTPFENNPRLSQEDMRRTVAVFRFILPEASIRLAGGRGLMSDQGRACFMGGANAVITGNMLTTSGVAVQTDRAMLAQLGFVARRCND